jgi:hypothetical protein
MGTFRVQDYAPHAPAPPCQPGSSDPGWPTDWSKLVEEYNPRVSIFVARLDIVDRLFAGSWSHIGDPMYDAYLLEQLRIAVSVLTSRGGKVVLMTTPYYSTGEQPNGLPWPEDNPARVDQYNAMVRQVAAENNGKVFVLDLNKLVDPDGHFQEYIDGVQVRSTDGIHWTYQGDCWLAPRILPQIYSIASNGVAPTPSTTAALVQHAESTFPVSLCDAPN